MTDLTFTDAEMERILHQINELQAYLGMLIRIKRARQYYGPASPPSTPAPPAGQSPGIGLDNPDPGIPEDWGEHQNRPEPSFDHEPEDFEDPYTYCACGNQMDPGEKKLFEVCKDCR